jgi:hypothetical protein
MTEHSNYRQPTRGTAAFAAGEHLYKHGPMKEQDLEAALDAVGEAKLKGDALQRALRTGWLTVQQDGRIAVSLSARVFYDRLAGIIHVKHVGQVAAARQPADIFTRPSLNKKYIPNPHGTRLDIPEWSVRGKEDHHAKA